MENVGYTARHHTFFEMLGNFSFGDYFKQQAIEYAWDFITCHLHLAPDKLWITVHKDDNESYKIWQDKIGVPSERIIFCGDEDNFWSMGDTGPCGPCTEIFYDHGEHIFGGPPGSKDADGDRFIEIWNLVFMQYNKNLDKKLEKLAIPSVDTGMGLERISAVLQNKYNNYDTDIFQPIFKFLQQIINIDKKESSVCVLMDHIRAVSFIIADGILPSNDGRGYVLKRIIRRAIRHGYKLGIDDIFFYRLVAPLVEKMAGFYPILQKKQNIIENEIKREEKRFSLTLKQGLTLLDNIISKTQGKTISGDDAFVLYDTYGFPLDLTADIAKENNLAIDLDKFNKIMVVSKEKSKSNTNFSNNNFIFNKKSEFLGYENNNYKANVIAIIIDNIESNKLLVENKKGIIILDKTPFYAESGGQVGDIGIIKNDNFIFEVLDTQKQKSGAISHYGLLKEGEVSVGDKVLASIDIKYRKILCVITQQLTFYILV